MNSKALHSVKHFNDLIIIHIEFDSPKVEMIAVNPRRTVYERIADLGGTLGLYSQITGATILTVLHLIILIMKGFYSTCVGHE